MKTTNFDFIAAAAPLNRTASIVRDGTGDTYDGRVPSWHAHWKAPPLPEGVFNRQSGGQDLSGHEFGQGMRVIRYHRRHKKTGAQWLVRCACGDYELRSTKAIRAAKDTHVCQSCDWFQHVKWVAENERRGRTVAAADAAILDSLAEAAR